MKKLKMSYTQNIACGFLIIILIGTILLSLPISSVSGESTPFVDSFFTATSATCVTGLVVYDTFTHWSIFGQIIILALIQIGGLGFMTVAILFSMFLKRKIGLKQRNLMQESVNIFQIGGVVKLTRHIVIGTLIFESIGAIMLAIRFCPEMGLLEGIYNAIFHSISAFCNAGFDLMGKYTPGSSLEKYGADPFVNITIMLLIIAGGIGFFVWEDIIQKKFKFKTYRLHTKVVLTTTLILILVPTILIFFAETSKNGSFNDMSTQHAVYSSLFQAVTPRTAGFNTVPIASLRDSTIMLMMCLMLVGGSPGSTAGGIKTTTFTVLILAIASTFKHHNNINVFKRRLEDGVIKSATTIFMVYMSLIFTAVFGICMIDNTPLRETLFEVTSAIGTVGISMGITSTLSAASRIIIAVLMFFGRVGCLTIMFSFTAPRHVAPVQLPVEKISIG